MKRNQMKRATDVSFMTKSSSGEKVKEGEQSKPTLDIITKHSSMPAFTKRKNSSFVPSPPSNLKNNPKTKQLQGANSVTSAGRPTIVLDKVTKFSEQVEVVVEDASKPKLNSKRVQMTQAIRKLKKKNDVRDAS